jgi:predicted AlkP superfamily pyrophosphatase or phosphodiesterase
MLDQDCKVRADPLTWTSYGDLDIPTGVLNSRVSREARYISYFAQVRCLHSALRRFLEGLKEIGAFEDATIIVHGDHGSRIARIAPLTTTLQPLSDEDMADMYSVLFAVRSPSLAPGYRQDLVSLQALFRETFLGGTRSDRPPQVYLDYPATIDTSLTKPPFPRRPMSDLRRAPNSL